MEWLADLIIIALVITAIVLALRYIIREKKKGNNCIGCPYSGSCNKNSCSFSGDNKQEKK